MFVKTAMASLILLSTVSAAYADSVEGVILAFDRKAMVLVLNDKTVWTLEGSESAVPPDLKAGEKVEINYLSAGEEGVTKIETIKRLSP